MTVSPSVRLRRYVGSTEGVRAAWSALPTFSRRLALCCADTATASDGHSTSERSTTTARSLKRESMVRRQAYRRPRNAALAIPPPSPSTTMSMHLSCKSAPSAPPSELADHSQSHGSEQIGYWHTRYHKLTAALALRVRARRQDCDVMLGLAHGSRGR
jgi:hypothetical protein